MELRKYLIPEIIIGDNSFTYFVKYAKNYNAQKILLVTDPGVIEAGWIKEAEMLFNSENLDYVIFKDITPNPKDYEVERGAQLYKNEKCNLIVAIGGGSVIDCAKAIGIVCTNNKELSAFEGVDNVRVPMPPLICVPTTAGSSADISQFAIVVNSKTNNKMAIISKALVPDVALIDSITTTTLSSELTASTGMDALVHAIEAYVSNASSIITDLNAIKAIKLINNNLLNAFNQPYDVTFRYNMMMGSMLAGMAFSNASLGIVHAIAHSIGGIYDLNHGECNAILLEKCIDYNYDACPDKFKNIYMALGGKACSDNEVKERLVNQISNLRTSLGISANFDKSIFKKADFQQIAHNAYHDPCLVTNPKPININQIEGLLQELVN